MLLVALFATVFAIGSAFTSKGKLAQKSPGTDYIVYVYNGSADPEDMRDQTNYVKLGTVPDPDCGSGEIICTILTDDTGTHPTFSSTNPYDDPQDFDATFKLEAK